MSKAIGGGGNSDLLLVALLIGGAMMYSRMGRAVAAPPSRQVYVPASAPASNGYGAAQWMGGMLSGMGLGGMFGGRSAMPDTYNASPATGGLNSFGLPGPIGGTLEDPWYG